MLRTCHNSPAIQPTWCPLSIRGSPSLSMLPGPPSQGAPSISMIHSPPLGAPSRPPCPTSVLHMTYATLSPPFCVHLSIIVIELAGNAIQALCNTTQGEHGSFVWLQSTAPPCPCPSSLMPPQASVLAGSRTLATLRRQHYAASLSLYVGFNNNVFAMLDNLISQRR